MRIHSDLKSIHDNLCKATIKAEVKGVRIAGVFEPIANPTPPVYIQPEELTLLLPLSDDKITNLVLSLDVCRNSVFDIAKVYEKKREDLQSRFTDVTVSADGAAIIKSDDPRLKLDSDALERLVLDLIKLTTDYLEDAESAMHGVHRLLAEKYNLGFSISAPERRLLGPGKEA